MSKLLDGLGANAYVLRHHNTDCNVHQGPQVTFSNGECGSALRTKKDTPRGSVSIKHMRSHLGDTLKLCMLCVGVSECSSQYHA